MTSELINERVLGDSVRVMASRLRARRELGIVRPWVSAELEHDVLGVSRFTQYGSEHEFRSDEAIERGGSGSAPSPMRYLLSGVAFCLQGWCAKTWAVHGVALESLAVSVRTMMDMRGEHLIGDTPAHPQWFVLDVRITSEADDRKAIALLHEASRRCPLSSLLAQATPIHHILEHNGSVVVDERPDELRYEHEEDQTR